MVLGGLIMFAAGLSGAKLCALHVEVRVPQLACHLCRGSEVALHRTHRGHRVRLRHIALIVSFSEVA
jgi:hypothetical protein